jgi:hypothetical protein
MWLTIGSGYARLIRTYSPEQALPRHPRAPVVENCLSAVVGPPTHFRTTCRMQASSRQRLGDRALFLALYQQLSHEPQSSCNVLLNKELWRHDAEVQPGAAPVILAIDK